MMSRWFIPLLLLGHQSCCVLTSLPPEDDTSTPPGSSTTSSSSSTGKKPNIFLIVADDLGWNDVPWHNNDIIAPNILDLARNGIILDRSYVQPHCSPSRSALMSGMYPFTIGRQGSVIRPKQPSGLTMDASPLLSEVLKGLNYSTHAVGKWHLGFCDWKYTPTERGFDTFFGYYTGAEDYFSHVRGSNSMGRGYDFRRNKEPDFSVKGTYSTNAFASYVEDLLDTRDPSDPFFLYMPFQSVHRPLQVPENYKELYKNIQSKSRRTYCGMVTAMDEAIGRMVAALKRTGHYNNTIIVFTTDNGGQVHAGGNNSPLRGNKNTYWEGGTRGPAFTHSLLLPHTGFTSDKLVHLVDWYTTLIALAGGKVKNQRDGFDVWKALTSPDASVPSPRTHMVYNIHQTHKLTAAIRIGDYKLIVGDPGKGDWIPSPKLDEEDTDSSENMTKFEDQGEENEEYGNENDDGNFREDKIDYEMPRDDIGNFVEEGNALNDITPQESGTYGNVTRQIRLETAFPTLEEFLENLKKKETKIQLYNVQDDPEERVDLSQRLNETVSRILVYLHQELKRYVPVDDKKNDDKGNPEHWNDIWTPGWC